MENMTITNRHIVIDESVVPVFSDEQSKRLFDMLDRELERVIIGGWPKTEPGTLYISASGALRSSFDKPEPHCGCRGIVHWPPCKYAMMAT